VKNTYIKNPLNYIGGKYKILDYIMSDLPSEINRFVDLFAGGLNVGINVKAQKIYANDQINYLIEMYELFKQQSVDETVTAIENIIEKYNLSKENVKGYNALRNDYNSSKGVLELFVITCYSFNHQIRFNNSHQFNTPFGKGRSSYNSSIKKNLVDFCVALQEKSIVLSNDDFMRFDFTEFGVNDVVYCDPPYLITTGSYNDGKRGFKDWSVKEENELLELLDALNDRGVKFALSNVFQHKGLTNDILIEWSKKYRVTYINKSYSNCNYQFKEKESKTVEVLITNYKVGESCQLRLET